VVLKDGQTLKDIYKERIPLYEKYADIVVDERHCTIEMTVQKIIKKLEDYNN
jgi:shikimate kinase